MRLQILLKKFNKSITNLSIKGNQILQKRGNIYLNY